MSYLLRFGLALFLESGIALFAGCSLKSDGSISGYINAKFTIV